jgi:hypothetical protein
MSPADRRKGATSKPAPPSMGATLIPIDATGPSLACGHQAAEIFSRDLYKVDETNGN